MPRSILYLLLSITGICLPVLLAGGGSDLLTAPARPVTEYVSAAEPGALSEDPREAGETSEEDSSDPSLRLSPLPRMKDWEITVLGPGDQPIEGVMIWEERTIYPPRTGPDGVGRISIGEEVHSVEVRLDSRVPTKWLTLKEEHTVVRFPDLPSLSISVVNAETGALLPDSVVWTTDATEPLVRRAGRSVLPCAPWHAGSSGSLSIEVKPPFGFVMEDSSRMSLGGRISTFTRSIEATVPTWPEADLRILVTEEDGRPVGGATVDQVWFKGKTSGTSRFTTDPSGVVRMTGIPSIPGESIRVFAGKDGRNAVSEMLPLSTSRHEVWATIVLPPEPREAWCYRSPSGNVPGCHRQPKHPEPVGSGALLVQARRVCGRPAAGALVELLGPKDERLRWRSTGVTDAVGLTLFEHLPAGPAFVQVREYGFIMPDALEVTVHAGTTTRVTVSEGKGEPVSVLVLTEQGVPVAGVELDFHPTGSGPDLWLEGTVQRIGFYTDSQGRFTLPRSPEGKVRVHARLGSRQARGEVPAGGTLVLQLGK